MQRAWKALEYICLTDKMIVCAHCAILGPHRSDLGHQVGPVDKMLEKAPAVMRQLQSKSKEVGVTDGGQ